MYEELTDHSFYYLSYEEKMRLIKSGAVVAQLYDRTSRLFRYVLPTGKVFAWERLEDEKVVLRE